MGVEIFVSVEMVISQPKIKQESEWFKFNLKTHP